MSDFVIFDSSVIIDGLRSRRHQERLQSVSGLVRNCSVVLAELWRGATRPKERAFVQALAKNHPILTPTESNWLDSGPILARIREERGLTSGRLRDLHFDVLIALTARSHGARVVTSNGHDFALISAYRSFRFEVW